VRRLLPLILLVACRPAPEPEGTASLAVLANASVQALASTADAMAWGDWDADGILDLAVGVNGVSNQVHIYLGDGTGVVSTAAWSSPAWPTINDLAFGDVGGDGSIDLGVATAQGARVVRSDGSLTAPTVWSSALASSVTEVEWVDVNNDGRLDLSGLRGGGGQVVVWQGVATSALLTTSQAMTSGTLVDTVSMTWGRTANGRPRCLVATNPNFVQVLVGGTSALLLESTLTVSGVSALASIQAGDITGDGFDDVVVGVDGGSMRVFEATSGGFGTGTVIGPTNIQSEFAFADYDGDGDLDLAVGYLFGDPVEIYENSGGSLDTAASWTASVGRGVTGLAWANLDGAGQPELTYSSLSAGIRVHTENGLGLGVPGASANLSNNSGDAVAVAFGDVDDDGVVDAVVAVEEGVDRAWAMNGFPALAPEWASPNDWDTTGVALGDVDRDGQLDLALTREGHDTLGNERVVVYLNTGDDSSPAGSAQFEATPVLEFTGLTNVPEQPVFVDWNRDGWLDLVFLDVSEGVSSAVFFLNNGGGFNATASFSFGVTGEVLQVAFDDVDGDPFPELSVLSENSSG